MKKVVLIAAVLLSASCFALAGCSKADAGDNGGQTELQTTRGCDVLYPVLSGYTDEQRYNRE